MRLKIVLNYAVQTNNTFGNTQFHLVLLLVHALETPMCVTVRSSDLPLLAHQVAHIRSVVDKYCQNKIYS